MARRWKAGMSGERYIGDKRDRLVHDLDNEKESCQVDEIIRTTNEVAFRTLDEALDQGYQEHPDCKPEEDEGECRIP